MYNKGKLYIDQENYTQIKKKYRKGRERLTRSRRRSQYMKLDPISMSKINY
jgi:hypothetical protein